MAGDRGVHDPGRSGAVVRVAGATRILVVANKVVATPALVEAVRKRASAGATEFVILVPNPAHLAFDRNSPDLREGDAILAATLPELEEAAEQRSRGESP